MLVEKPLWKQRYTQILGKPGYNEFMKFNARWLRRSLRVNTLKTTKDELVSRLSSEWGLEQIPWCELGFWIKHRLGERRDIGNTPEYQLGYYYVQEASSMIPALVLNPKPGDIVLDMCASPGSKSTQIAAMMENQGVLVANDYKGSRLAALGINLQRCGVTNALITLMHGQMFKGELFDKVLLDAPCSGTGSIRKSQKTLEIWNPASIRGLAGQQRILIRVAFSILKPGGTLVYSTCSVEPEENEEVVDSLLRASPNACLEPISLNIKRSMPVLRFEGRQYSRELLRCLRLWPQDNDTGGFFVAKIRKLA